MKKSRVMGMKQHQATQKMASGPRQTHCAHCKKSLPPGKRNTGNAAFGIETCGNDDCDEAMESKMGGYC